MRKLTYTGPVDTLELADPEDPAKMLFSGSLHPGKAYKLPDEGHDQVIDNMVGRGLFVDPKTENTTSPGNDTSPAAPAPATVPETSADAAGKPKRS